ncbi:MAG: hypothetical protein JO171_02500 [Paludibacterium sp.]|nr:hypothetical protein [Paludibacterium sp.]
MTARFCIDELDVMLTAAQSGLGIARLPTWLARGRCGRGRW